MNTSASNLTDDKSVEWLFSPLCIRERAKAIYDLTKAGKTHFVIDETRFQPLVDYVQNYIEKEYPNWDIPYHSRWRHFELEGTQCVQRYQRETLNKTPLERARLGFDLIVPSVLLDAGAGSEWSYTGLDSARFTRSEGLGLASIEWFLAKGFSSSNELRSDAAKLINLTVPDLEEAFQITRDNPLTGVQGRVQLLNKLGHALKNNARMFPNKRIGDLADYLVKKHGESLSATDVFATVLEAFGEIWPNRETLNGISLGDVWLYKNSNKNFYVPFHKLSQWLTYSLVETLESSGLKVANVDHLTGLAEYRNGGLLIDSGLITLKELNNNSTKQSNLSAFPPHSPQIIEWRALTIYFLDEISQRLRESKGLSSEELPLVKILQGGTWAAGRELAFRRCASGNPPISIISDGTVF